jgi:hypothetical protein
MLTIHKYEFEITDKTKLKMHEGAKILKIECQNQTPRLWAMVDDSAPMVDYEFLVIGTGYAVPGVPLKHISTFQQQHFVWHVFEVETPHG